MKNGVLKLEKGIPIPDHQVARSETGKLMRAMKLGESFLFPIGKRAVLSSHAKLAKIKIITRTVDAKHVRVWRTK